LSLGLSFFFKNVIKNKGLNEKISPAEVSQPYSWGILFKGNFPRQEKLWQVPVLWQVGKIP
jgi:hypothetical protein